MSVLKSFRFLSESSKIVVGTVAFSFAISGASLMAEERTAVAVSAASSSAQDLMNLAHSGRAEWENFPGFTARVKAFIATGCVEGDITVSSEGAIQHTFPTTEEFAWVDRSLDSLIGHRLPTGSAIRNVEFADEQSEHPNGRLLRSSNPDERSFWRVQGDVVTEVHRATDKSRFIISVGDVWRTAENKHLPRNFTVTTWEMPSNRIITARQVHTEWVRVGTFDLPLKNSAKTNRSDGSTVVHQLEFSNHKLTAK